MPRYGQSEGVGATAPLRTRVGVSTVSQSEAVELRVWLVSLTDNAILRLDENMAVTRLNWLNLNLKLLQLHCFIILDGVSPVPP